MKRMEISYVREMRKNYLTVGEMRENQGYEAHMLAANRIQGLLGMKVRYRDGNALYYYDITSRQPLGRLLENRQVMVEEICSLLRQIYSTLRRMEEFFLGDGGILLEPEYIYMEPEAFQAGLCFVPGLEKNFPEELSHLLQYLLRHVDHRDRKAVILAYSLYQESLKENYCLEDLLHLMEREEKKETDGAKEERDIPAEEKEQTEEEQENWMDYKETENGEQILRPSGSSLWKSIICAVAVMLLIPGILWVFRGKGFILEHIKWVGTAQAGVLFFTILAAVWKRRPGKKRDFGKDGSVYEETDIPEEPFPEREEEKKPQKNEEIFRTVLLNDGSEQNMHRLEGISPETEDIVISYYPFVIGKHRELADYVLDRDTVSRLHLRCDREGDTYTVTDLNSTNGTMVRGVLLDANETVEIKSGDPIVIADVAYVWR